MVKLYNKTQCPDEILKPLIVAAGQRIGTRTAKVVVKVTQARPQTSLHNRKEQGRW